MKLIVLGTISAPEAPILAVNMSGRSGVGFKGETQAILAWRIIPTASGHVAIFLDGKTVYRERLRAGGGGRRRVPGNDQVI